VLTSRPPPHESGALPLSYGATDFDNLSGRNQN